MLHTQQAAIPETVEMVPPGDIAVVLREAELIEWEKTARPGDWVCYHRGHLARDRVAEGLVAPATRRAIGRVAAMAWAFARAGHVTLVQARKRLESGAVIYEYWAVKL